jgi:hypothetical protein
MDLRFPRALREMKLPVKSLASQRSLPQRLFGVGECTVAQRHRRRAGQFA